MMLYRRYRFNHWHISAIEWRPYALELVEYLRELVVREKLSRVVEIGCGLGEVLSRIPAPDRVGYDLDENVLRAAHSMHPDIHFQCGSFDDISGKTIDLLIVVNFPHRIPPDQMKNYMTQLGERNRLKYLVVDKVRYAYYHDYDVILGERWRKVWESRPFESDRTVMCYLNTQADADS
jgi:trans-aconitate methyltransferase